MLGVLYSNCYFMSSDLRKLLKYPLFTMYLKCK